MRTSLAIVVMVLTTIGGVWVSRPPDAKGVAPEPIPWTPARNRTQETGRRIYLKRCAWCHGKERDGFGLNATKLGTPPADFTTPQFRNTHPKALLMEWASGKRPRPAPLCPNWQGTLAPAEIGAVAEYLLSSAD